MPGLLLSPLLSLLAAQQAPFRIDCVDAQTGRGVPLVQLQTTDGQRWISDSAGVVAVREPALDGLAVWFFVQSPGYELPADGFGYRGARLEVRSGGRTRIELRRTQIAQRLYRSTGRGRYRDSILCGDQAPVAHSELNARIMGQDTVQCVRYGEGLFWVFGDTSRPSYPLGQFWCSGGTSLLPAQGGPDPALGLEIDYFVGEDGFSRGLCRREGPGVVWIHGLCVALDAEGALQMFGHYERLKGLGESLEQGLVEWDPSTQHFERVLQWAPGDGRHPIGHLVGLHPRDRARAAPNAAGRPTVPAHEDRPRGSEADEWLLFGSVFPTVRVPAAAEALRDPEAYECWSCLREGEGDGPSRILREADGTPHWRWCRAQPLGLMEMFRRQQELSLKEDDSWLRPRDVLSGRKLLLHAGSIEWNESRGCYVLIANEQGGEHSFLGDVWYGEADSPMGPWIHVRRIAWHDKVSFYNPFQHPWFARDQGRVLHFEGTYSQTFSASQEKTPRYDDNQLHYRLDTDDPRLALPRPVYRVRDGAGGTFLATAAQVHAQGLEPQVEGCAFLLLPAEREHPHTVSVHCGEFVLGRALLEGALREAAPVEGATREGPAAAFHPADLISLDRSTDRGQITLGELPPGGEGPVRAWRCPMPDPMVRKVVLAWAGE